MKEFCRYAVIDIETGNVLCIGFKYKDFSTMHPESIFRSFPCFWRKITEYAKIKFIKGRACYLIYWTGEREKEIGSCVCLMGRELRLRGPYRSDSHINFKPLLHACNIL